MKVFLWADVMEVGHQTWVEVVVLSLREEEEEVGLFLWRVEVVEVGHQTWVDEVVLGFHV